MDRVVIERKLESLRRCVDRVRSKRPASLAVLTADIDLQDVLVLNLSRAVQLCVDVGAHVLSDSGQPAPLTMGDTFSQLADAGLIGADLALRLRKAVGFRNVAVYNYEVIDWAIVHAVADTSVKDFEDFAREIARRLGD
jgi:uncharacterized protein YutE (UPF0331/DUF86 family)